MTAVWSASATGRSYSGDATAYCGGGTTASGVGVYWGEVANNFLAFGTWIEMRRPRKVRDRRFFQVQDTGGPGFLIDIYHPSCSWAEQWGRRNVLIRVLGRSDLWHGRPKGGWHWQCCWPRPRFTP